MPLDLSDTFVIGISATSLFDLKEADDFFRARFTEDRETAIVEYRQYMLEREEQALEDGTAMPLVRALLNLNSFRQDDDDNPLVEVVVMSRNSPETGIRVFNNIRERDLPITRHAFTGGESVVDYLEAYDVDLFLTTNINDAQRVVDEEGSCAVALVKEPPEETEKIPEEGNSGDSILN